METKENLLYQIGTIIPSLTNSQRKVADYILQNTTEVIFLTIEQLASKTDTSVGTITRLSNSLGYSGYSHLLKDLQKTIQEQISPGRIFKEKLQEMESDNLFQKVIDSQINNLHLTTSMVSQKILDQVVEALINSNKIYVCGYRMAYTIAFYLYHYFNRLLGNSELLVTGMGDLPERINRIDQNDVLIAIAFPRYTTQVINVAQIAQKKKAKVISISDGYHSPLRSYSDILLTCGHTSATFHNSPVGAMLIAEYIVCKLAISNPKQTLQRLQDVDEIMEKWNYHCFIK